MFTKANPGRDAFKFSLKGMTAIASFAPVPAIADDQINKRIGDRLAKKPTSQRATLTRDIEDFLVRVFVPGAGKTS